MDATQILNEEKFSVFPEEMDNFFFVRDVTINTFPDKYIDVIEAEFKIKKLTNAQQLYDFINQEMGFWDLDKDSKISILKCYSKLKNANDEFAKAKVFYESGRIQDANNLLSRVLNYFNTDYLCSKTKLAKFLVEQQDRGPNFFIGIDLALKCQDNLMFNYTINSGNLEGYIAGMVYRNELKQVSVLVGKAAKNFTENIIDADKSYSDLNRRYTESFHIHENQIAEIKTKTNEEIENLKKETLIFFNLKEQRSKDLETLYADKLRLEKPAQYWKDMANSYSKQGKLWLGASCVTAASIIVMLILIIAYVPNLFNADSHWFDIFKNSAIITVIASIAIYMLRMFVKMTMSSLHLSRDAKEREQLSYFYLALIESKAVTDKEKALIINSLFSRSDTGLLKGDSTPIMTANVGEIIEKITKNDK